MESRARDPRIRVEMELRVVFAEGTERLSDVLDLLRRADIHLKGHFSYRLAGEVVALLLCDTPTEAALALREAGLAVETETVVTVLVDDRPGALGHILRTLLAEGIAVGYGYSTVTSEKLFIVLRTDNNPLAEDVLRKFLILHEDPEIAPPR